MKVQTTRFGVVEIEESSVLEMPKGPLGFEERTRYCLLQNDPSAKFRWLQSLDAPSLAFVVVDPSDFCPGYEVDIPDADAERLHLSCPDDALVLAIVAVSDDATEVTANLAAPVVINTRELIGMQVIVQDLRYSIRHALVDKVNTKTARAA